MTTTETPESGAALCIIPGPKFELVRRSAGVRWCFACRAHLAHDDVLLDDNDPAEVAAGRAEPSYYDLIWVRECSRCHKDRTDFPGTIW